MQIIINPENSKETVLVNKLPRISVIIPTYKRTDYLKLTLESVYSQTFTDFEVIVIDDGTPGEENKKICSTFQNLIYKKIANTGGPMIPRNTGLKMAKGEYIALVDDDDLWIPDKLQRQIDILDNEKDFGLVHGCCKVIDNSGKETGEIVGIISGNNRKHGYVFDDMVGNFTLMMPTVFFRKQLLDLVPGFNETMKAAGEDTEFFCRLAFYTKFYFMEQPVAYYRYHPSNLSGNEGCFFYTYLPLSLFKMIKDLNNRKLLSNKRFKRIRNTLLIKQSEECYSIKAYKLALKHCFLIYPLFFLKPKVVYILYKKFLRIRRKRK